MMKKILSMMGIVGILSTMIVQTAFAGGNQETVIEGLLADLGTFNASAGESMNANFDVIEAPDSFTARIVELNLSLTPVLSTNCEGGACDASVTWNGKQNNTVVADGTYTLEVKAVKGAIEDTDTATVRILTPLDITSFSVPTTWNPVQESLSAPYTLSKSATVSAEIKRGTTLMQACSASSGTVTCTGKSSDDLFLTEGEYTLVLTAVSGVVTKTKSENFTVKYFDNAPKIGTVSASLAKFTAADQESTVSFGVDNSAYVKVEVKDANGKVVHTPTSFDGEIKYSNTSNDFSFVWDGKEYGMCARKGLYTVEITALNNDTGFDFSNSMKLEVDYSSCFDGSSRIKNIVLDPSGTWDPLEEDLEIEWETITDFDKFKIEARKGDDVIEVYEEDDLEIDEYDVDFNGKDDDDEYLSQGPWTLVFFGEVEGLTYFVEKSFTVGYTKPAIDDIFVTKTEIDPDLGEGVYVGFSVSEDAKVNVEVLRNGNSKVTLLEDEEITKEKWYAIYWDGLDEDGDTFKKDDSFKVQLTACSPGDDDVCNTKSLVVDLDDDEVSSSKSNITLDLLTPPVVKQGGNVELTFNMEEAAKLRVGIWKGTSTSGSPDVELLPYTDMKSGDYKFIWDTKDKNGKLMAKGYYSYKVFTQKGGSSSTETETGRFVIGTVGDVYGGPSETVSDETPSSGSDSSRNPYLVIDDDDSDVSFPDVLSNNKNYDAIIWASKEGIFIGDSSGKFRPYDSINRAEVLTVVMRAFALPTYSDDGTNLGWNDVIVGEWYMGALRSGKLNGLLAGDGGKKTVRPGDSVSRVELLKFIYESAKMTGVSTVGACSFSPYSDVSVGNWFSNYVCQARNDGLFDILGGMFSPDFSASRGEVAEALYRLLNK